MNKLKEIVAVALLGGIIGTVIVFSLGLSQDCLIMSWLGSISGAVIFSLPWRKFSKEEIEDAKQNLQDNNVTLGNKEPIE